jgi:hypothetical protein
MSYGGIISQGTFTQNTTANGGAITQFIAIPSGVDRMEVVNYSQSIESGTSGHGTSYLWYRGMPVNQGLYTYHPASDHTLAVNTMASGGFTVVDSSSAVMGAAIVASGGITNAASMVLTMVAANALGIIAGYTVIRILDQTGDPVTQTQTINNKDFLVVTVTPNTPNSTITLVALANAPVLANPTGTIHFQIVYVNTEFYPKARIIASITPNSGSTPATIVTTVPHGLTVGQQIRFNIPACCGSVQLNPSSDNLYLSATVTSVVANAVNSAFPSYSFTVDTDMTSTGYNVTAFTYPTYTNYAAGTAGFPRIVPIGENTAEAISAIQPISQDATVNQAQLGMILGLGVAGDGTNGPAGAQANIMYWSAWKAANTTNE